ncbi:MAG: hypothetical protein CMQ73_00570 [Gammaproteobacteria bacterium]|nr:hypothetical protein [Gammaproteobacteria bacterium]OUT97008.1 MAG: hypothetical protein CBB96_00755 [Gammaproteobacteria bacterium TMED36]|tara:strand:+ start:120 stop:476 length:357 start_codon:yes stop_codon:yes gene_type:complete
MNMTTNALIEERTDTKIKFKGNWYEQSLLIHDNNIISPWKHPIIDQMTIEDFSFIIENQCELVLFGTGKSQVFPSLSVTTELQKMNIGIEIMDTKSACRTFNVLTSEYRNPTALIVID